MNKSIRLSTLLNDCITLVHEAGTHVKSTAQKSASTRMGSTYDASKTSKVSREQIQLADFKIRQTYLHNLTQLYPGLKLICQGEAPINSSSQTHFAVDPFLQPDELLEIRESPLLSVKTLSSAAASRKEAQQNYKSQLEAIFGNEPQNLNIGEFQDEFPIDEVSVWIDPIDGSHHLEQGNLQSVTCLVGISVNSRPVAGIIHKPFQSNSTTTEPQGRLSMFRKQHTQRTFVGTLDSGLFSFDLADSDKSVSTLEYHPPFEREQGYKPEIEAASSSESYQPRLCLSANPIQNSYMENVVGQLDPKQVQRVHGPGNKFLHMTEENSDFFVNFIPGPEMMTMCSAEAIFASRHGILTDARQKPLFYDASRRSFSLWNGLVASKNARIYQAASQQFEQKSGNSFAQKQTQIRREVHLQNVKRAQQAL